MSLGVEAGKKELVSNLAMFVRKSGGHDHGNKVENAEKLSTSVNHAEDWFKGRNCLFIIDDI